MFRYANLGGRVENFSKEPGFPIAMGTEPHPDALAVHRAVMALQDKALVMPDGAPALLGDLAQYLTDGERFALASLNVQVPGLVTLHARMGNRPIWQVDYKVVRMIGRNRRSVLRKGRGSVKLQGDVRLNVPASEILTARFEYTAWHNALCDLAAGLGYLRDHAPTPPMAPAEPWFQPDTARIFSDATEMDARELASGRAEKLPRLPLVPRRPRILPQLPAAHHGPVRHVSFSAKKVT